MAKQPLRHLPPHLRDVCNILAVGLLRLRERHNGDRDGGIPTDALGGDISLHIQTDPSMYGGSQTGRSP